MADVWALCRRIGGLHPDPAITEAAWAAWLPTLDGVTMEKARRCPECDGRLVERTGKFGAFLGCEMWPDCRHTEAA